ncbi:MAG: DUF960 domain-containing protein [Firmicutes bacterium]|nr:DUF960 domain-containing protein [Bacillota bacterium]
MFGSNRYITRGINQGISMDLTIFLWSRVDALKLESDGDMDYLQVFELKEIKDPEVKANQLVIHRTEEPEYRRTHAITVEKPITEKVYVIDSGDYSTMLFAREY